MSEGPIQYNVYGTQELLTKFAILGNFSRSKPMRALLEDAGNAYVILAQESVPKQTRILKASIHHKVQNWGTDNPGVNIGSSARYAWYVEGGTNPSVRYARRARFMHWFMEGAKTLQLPSGGRGMTAYSASLATGTAYSVFAKRVNHPGTKAQPFFFIHFDNISGRFVVALNRILNEAITARATQG